MVSLLAFVVSTAYVYSLDEPKAKAMVFLTIGLDQRELENEVSSYEILRATEHFADIVLGWTNEPSFENELEESLGYPIDLIGQRQEKQNLIYTVSVDSEKVNEEVYVKFIDLLQSRLNEYGQTTKSGYVIAFSTFSELDSGRSEFRFISGSVLMAFLLSGFIVYSIDYASKNRN